MRKRGAHGIPRGTSLRGWWRELGDQWDLGKDLGRGQTLEALRGHSIRDAGLEGDGAGWGVEEMDSGNEFVKERSDVGS